MLKVFLLLVFLWILLTAFYLYFRKRFKLKVLKYFLWIFFLLLFIEFTAQLGFKWVTGLWVYKIPYNENALLFEPHPYLVGMPRKNVSLQVRGKRYTHNSLGWRNKEFSLSKKEKRIIVVGGSTVYGIGVNDDETWPYYLDSLAGDTLEVLNFGVPGHSSVEHIHLLQYIIPDYQPDLIVIQCGLNDLRNMFVDGLKPDYSNFHQPTLYGTLGFCYLNHLPRLASLRLIVILLQKMGLYPVCDFHRAHYTGKVQHGVDSVALSYFNRHVKNMIQINDGTPLLFVPHVLSRERVLKGDYSWWIPFLDKNSIIENMTIYNQVLASDTIHGRVYFADNILKTSWPDSLFADPSHLNARGNLIFAQQLWKKIKSIPF